MDADQHKKELEGNYRAFEKLLPTLRPQDKFALLRHGDLINIFDSTKDALIFASAQFPDGMYSVQQVTNKTIELGYFSHAVLNSNV